MKPLRSLVLQNPIWRRWSHRRLSAYAFRLKTAEFLFLYNTANWPSSELAGGYVVDVAGYLLPSQIVASSVAAWSLTKKNPYTMAERVMRGWLHVSKVHGVERAIHYVFDLVQYGYVNHPACLALVLEWILASSTLTENVDSVPAQVVGRDLQSTEPWSKIELSAPEIVGESINVPRPTPSRATRDIMAVIASAVMGRVDAARQAVRYDDWLMSQYELKTVLDAFCNHCAVAWRRASGLASRALAEALEEIRADAGGYSRLLRARFRHPFAFNPAIFEAMMLVSRASDGGEIRQLIDTRAVPAALRVWLASRNEGVLPKGWSFLSAETAVLVANAIFREPQLRFLDTSEEEADPEQLRAVLYRLVEANAGGDTQRARRIAVDAVVRYPWNEFVHQELAIALDRADELDAALAAIERAILINPRSASLWQSLSVITRRQGDSTQALLVRVLAEWIESEESKRGDEVEP
ncbi:hypothetical protein WMF39_46625 [Sorangium sp. So ce1504]|uniref:hypothetical protein n=1 Tax=Sorangium sp. So ce1504 TaxID=3133337 RepID=UPI003F609508